MANKEVRICENCGTKNPVSNLECVVCGYDLSFVIPTPDETEDIMQISDNSISKKTEWVLISRTDKEYVINIESETMIGREAGQMKDYLNRSDYISRNHAKLIVEDDKLYVVDASTNGTFINDIRIEKMKRVSLNCGDVLRFADVSFVVGKSYAN